jgi:hypothetical protein
MLPTPCEYFRASPYPGYPRGAGHANANAARCLPAVPLTEWRTIAGNIEEDQDRGVMFHHAVSKNALSLRPDNWVAAARCPSYLSMQIA